MNVKNHLRNCRWFLFPRNLGTRIIRSSFRVLVMTKTITFSFLFAAFAISIAGQIPESAAIAIMRAEDSRVYGSGITDGLESTNPALRARAALAAGRIGDEAAIPALVKLLSDGEIEVSATAAFALGEIESAKASEAVLKLMRDSGAKAELRARAVEAAGKIAAANRDDASAAPLKGAILALLEAELRKGQMQSADVIRLGLTAALRARPDNADSVIAKFFTNEDARVRADAANAYSRVQGKSASEQLQEMLTGDKDPIARANAARALGVAGDKTALNKLLAAAESDEDQRVRVSAIRSVGQINDPATAERVMKQVGAVFGEYKASKDRFPAEQNELLDAVTALGRVAGKTADKDTLTLLKEINEKTGFRHGEIESAIARIDPSGYWPYLVERPNATKNSFESMSATNQGLSAISDFIKSDEQKELRQSIVADSVRGFSKLEEAAGKDPRLLMAIPAVIGLYADLSPEGSDAVLRDFLKHRDVFVRAAAASAIGDRSASSDNFKALAAAFAHSLKNDKGYDDAKLAMLSAIVKLDKLKAKDSITAALGHYEYLVRKRASELIRANGLEKEFPDTQEMVGGVGPYDAGRESMLGQVTMTDADYKRALGRRNGKVSAVVSTAKGKFTIEFFPEEAPITVDNFVTLAKEGYFNGISIHRVVPNFVVQDGDPRGDGNGGPGWQIRCEINTIPYDRGMVGMALSGKDTGGSQWFITHSPQPHLDGGYTVFGRVPEIGMAVIDRLSRGDVITSVEIVE